MKWVRGAMYCSYYVEGVVGKEAGCSEFWKYDLYTITQDKNIITFVVYH
jgi:hypothetical protein